MYLDAARGSLEARTELLARLRPLVLSSIRKNYNRQDEMDDLVQEGYLLILESIPDYRKDYSVPFLGFIKSRLRFHYLGKNRIRRELSLNTVCGEGGEEHLDLLEDDYSMEGSYLDKEARERLLYAMEALTKRERQVVEGYYFHSRSIGEIAKSYGITYRTVINTKKRALERLKGEMDDENL